MLLKLITSYNDCNLYQYSLLDTNLTSGKPTHITAYGEKLAEDRLILELLADYNKFGRPVKNAKDAVNVSFSYSLMNMDLVIKIYLF